MMATKDLPNPDDLVLKVILVGDSGVGKSCLLKSFMGDPFKGVYTSTIGVDFEIKPIQIDGKTVNLQIWDTAGQERFRTITTSYYRSADAILMVFDLTDEKTFSNLEAWMEDVRLYAQRHVEIMLVGNKVDLNEERVVDYKEAKSYAEKHNFQYFETSAKTKINVDKAFTKLTQTVYQTKVAAMQKSQQADASQRRVSLTAQNSQKSAEGDGGCAC
jgi:small GTP-binding protein